MTYIVLPAAGTGPAAHLAIIVKEGRILPDLSEALRVQVTSFKFWSLEEGAWVDLALWTNTARSRRSSTHIKTRQPGTKGVEVKERIGCQNIGVRH